MGIGVVDIVSKAVNRNYHFPEPGDHLRNGINESRTYGARVTCAAVQMTKNMKQPALTLIAYAGINPRRRQRQQRNRHVAAITCCARRGRHPCPTRNQCKGGHYHAQPPPVRRMCAASAVSEHTPTCRGERYVCACVYRMSTIIHAQQIT